MTEGSSDTPRAAGRLAPSPDGRARMRAEIRALLTEAALVDSVAERLDAVLARDGPSAVPKWIAEFLSGEAGALAHVLPRRPRLPHIRGRDVHGL